MIKPENINQIKYLSPASLFAQLESFTSNMVVTKGMFEMTVQNCKMEDIEWNHMDQMHRPTIHNTYEKGIRIAAGENFAVSLTEWGRWPFLIPVTDVYVDRGLFYQSLTLAGVIFIHSIISMEEDGDNIKLKDEWFIASRKLFKFLHRPINKKLYKLNARLQAEDQQVREGRFELRKQGYQFNTDCPNYYNSNLLGTNTIYPRMKADAEAISLENVNENIITKQCGGLEFLIKKTKQNSFLIWPAVCPHEGGPLSKGNVCESKIACPWHGLKFSAVELSESKSMGASYGFEYQLIKHQIFIKQSNIVELKSGTLDLL